jgi:hypothetical protein
MSRRKNRSIDWKNRIVEHGEQAARHYQGHELNARRHPEHQRDALVGSLNELGWVAPVIVSSRTGKLLDGHARIMEALDKDPGDAGSVHQGRSLGSRGAADARKL